MLLRNLDISEGFTTVHIVKDRCYNIIKSKIITAEYFGRLVHIPEQNWTQTRASLVALCITASVSVRPKFAITIHKHQGETFVFVGLDKGLRLYARNAACCFLYYKKAFRPKSLASATK